MEMISTFLMNTWWLFFIIAIFSIFALIGYVVESKVGAVKKINTNTFKPAAKEIDIDKIKTELANSNKSLNSMVGNPNQPAQNIPEGVDPSVLEAPIGINNTIQGATQQPVQPSVEPVQPMASVDPSFQQVPVQQMAQPQGQQVPVQPQNINDQL